ncbi:MAG: TonB-dependent receptor [Marinifilaceae bacterium]|nr:TonB-dependent receptor [Marinifilaceae bacterium]
MKIVKTIPTIICFLLASINLYAINDTIQSKNIDEIVVTGTRNESDIRHLPMTISTLNREQLDIENKVSILPTLNIHVPGFFSTSRGVLGYGVSTGASGQMSLRGIGGAPQAGVPTSAILVLIDGHPQYMGLMGHPIADAYLTNNAERIEVLRGPASVLYGSNAMGGVINIVTRKSKEEGIFTHANIAGGSYGTFTGEASNTIKRGAFTNVINAQYSRSDGHRPNMGFEQYGGYIKIGYEINERWKSWGDVNITHFNASNPGAVSDLYIDNDQRITRGVANFAIENRYKRSSGTISGFYNWGKHWINDGYKPGESPLDYRFNSKDMMAGVQLYQSSELFTGNRITLGFDYFHFGGKAYNRFDDGEKSITADKAMDEYAAYIDIRQHIKSWLTINIGGRMDHHSHTGTEFIPQGGVALHLPRQTEVKAMVGKGFRNATIREMFMFPPQNPDLQPEELWSYELSFNKNALDGRVKFGANLFYINGKNLIMRLPNPNGSGMLNQNSGKIENWGAEGDIACTINNSWYVFGNYSWLNMKEPLLASPEHKLCGGAIFNKKAWRVSANIQYINGLYTDLTTRSKEAFVLVEMQSEFSIAKVATLYIKGENILAQKYEIMAGYPMPKATFMGGIKFKLKNN